MGGTRTDSGYDEPRPVPPGPPARAPRGAAPHAERIVVPKLTIEEGAQRSVFELFDDEVTVGRGASNSIQVVDGHASKFHAVIRRVGGRLKLIDLESKNGTRVNGEFRNQRWLEDGDVVSIGALTMAYDGVDEAGRPLPTSATYAAAPVVSGPALAPAPRPTPAAPGRTARRARDEHAGDDEAPRPRLAPRRSSNNAAVAMMVGLGVVGVIAIMILLLSGSGAGSNAIALRDARAMLQRDGDVERALAHLKAHSDPADRDGYIQVAGQIKEWQSMVDHREVDAKEETAKAVRKKLLVDQIEQHKNGFSDVALGQRVLQFLEDYRETVAAKELANLNDAAYVKLRAKAEQARAAGR